MEIKYKAECSLTNPGDFRTWKSLAYIAAVQIFSAGTNEYSVMPKITTRNTVKHRDTAAATIQKIITYRINKSEPFYKTLANAVFHFEQSRPAMHICPSQIPFPVVSPELKSSLDHSCLPLSLGYVATWPAPTWFSTHRPTSQFYPLYPSRPAEFAPSSPSSSLLPSPFPLLQKRNRKQCISPLFNSTACGL